MDAISSQMKITAVNGNRQRLDGGAMFGNVPRALWENWLPADEHGRVELQCRTMLIEHADLKILCETGIGAFFEPKLASRFGVLESRHMLVENLKTLNLSTADIDYVILSHLHFDHAGGLLPSYEEIAAGDNDLIFPNAKFLVGAEAFARCKDPHDRDRASFIPGLAEKLEKSGRLIVISADEAEMPAELKEILSFRYSYGHTPGQMHTVVHGAKHTVVFAGDLIPGLPWVHLPVTMGYDRFPELLIDEKKELYAQAAPNGWYLFFTHDADTALARVKPDEKGKYIPVDMIKNPVGFQI